MRQAIGPGALGRPRGIGWRGRWEGGLGWGTHVNPWLFHFNVWQNPLQFKKKSALVTLPGVSVCESHSDMSDSLRPHRLYSPWNPPGQNTGVGNHSLLQGAFPTQRSNRGLLHCRWILYSLSHQGSPRIQEWEAYPFSRGSSQPRNQTRVSCIASGFFNNWATREIPKYNNTKQ